MRRMMPGAVAMLSILLALPVAGRAQNDTADPNGSNAHDALHDRIDARHDDIHESLREQHQALLDRLGNADLSPAEKRRIYNALTDNLEDRHDLAHDRLRRAHDAAHDRPRDVRPDARPDLRPDVRPDVRPEVRPVVRPPRVGVPGPLGPPNRRLPAAPRVARTAVRR